MLLLVMAAAAALHSNKAMLSLFICDETRTTPSDAAAAASVQLTAAVALTQHRMNHKDIQRCTYIT
jgi:hypothetical protein